MSAMTDRLTLEGLFKLCNNRLEKNFSLYLPTIPSSPLKDAVAYAMLNGGKHLRPLLVYATSRIFNAPLDNADLPALAVELIHTYSLVHDDLPCMDNADLRRGKPACHKAFDEGMAVLVGDGLQTLAIQVLAGHPSTLKPERRLQMVKVLSEAAGIYGMVGGQALDITEMKDPKISKEVLTTIHRLKTGALFTACIELGRLASDDNKELNQQALKHFGDCIGFAFQIQDDILDVEVGTDELGKTQGIDTKNKKITYPGIFGVSEAKQKVKQLYQEAFQSIDYLGTQAELLRELANYILQRKK